MFAGILGLAITGFLGGGEYPILINRTWYQKSSPEYLVDRRIWPNSSGVFGGIGAKALCHKPMGAVRAQPT